VLRGGGKIRHFGQTDWGETKMAEDVASFTVGLDVRVDQVVQVFAGEDFAFFYGRLIEWIDVH